MKKRILPSLLALSLATTLLTSAVHAADTTWTEKDAYGNPAPVIEGVKWYLAPTVGGRVNIIDTRGYVEHSINSGNGILNRFGEVVTPEKYASAEVFNDVIFARLSRSAYESNGALFSTDGKQITEHRYQSAVRGSYYADETGRFIQVFGGTRDAADDCLVYINLDTGTELPRFKRLGYFCEGRAGFTDFDERVGYMDTEGNKTFAPSDFTYVNVLPGNTLEYVVKISNGDELRGICDLNFKTILQQSADYTQWYASKYGVVMDNPFDRKTGEDHTTLYDFSGNVIVPVADRSYDIFLNDKGERCASYWDNTSGKRAERILNLDTGVTTLGENDGLPEGYYVEGEQEIVGYGREGTIGLKGPTGNWVIPQNYRDLNAINVNKKILVVATEYNEDTSLYDLTGKKLVSGGYIMMRNPMWQMQSQNAEDEDSTSIPMLSLIEAISGKKNGFLIDNRKCTPLDSNGKKLAPPADQIAVAPNGFMTSDYGLENSNLYRMNGTLVLANCGYFLSEFYLAEGLGIMNFPSGEDAGWGSLQEIAYCNDSLELIFPNTFDTGLEPQGGQMWVNYQGKWGIIDNPLNDTAEKAWGEHLAATSDTTTAADFLAKLPTAEQKHWAAESFGKLGAMGIVSGYPDGHFGPDDSVTRGSMAKLVLESSSRLGKAIGQSDAVAFADAADLWSAPFINGLAAAGILAPADYPNGFREGQPMTRAEVAKILVRALGYTDDGSVTATPFPDVTTGYYYIAKAAELGIITGYPNGNFGPADPVTRGTAAVMLVRAMSIAR